VAEVAGRGITIGWVVATPPGATPTDGIRPDGGGLIGEVDTTCGGVWIFGGLEVVFATTVGTWEGFLSFLPNEKRAI
jgi:hypothetical protein